MFGSTRSPSTANSYQSNLQLAYSKREQFRMEIRRRQIEQIKKQIRAKLFRFKDPNDAQILCKIDLNKIIYDLKNTGMSPQIVHQMFLYATSSSADHLYTLFDQKVVEILIDNMVQRQLQNGPYLHGQGDLKWDRKIFWVLTNFTSQSTVLHEQYLQNLYRIADYVYKVDQMKQSAPNRNQLAIPFFETQQNIVLSLSNLLMQSLNCRQIIYNYSNLFYRIFQRFYSRKPQLSHLIKTNKAHLPKLVIYYCEFLHNIYSCIEYDQIYQPDQKLALKQIRRILFAMVNERLLQEEDKKVVLLFLDSITKLFGHTLDNKPKYLLTHKKQFWKLSQWFEIFMKTQQKSEKCNQIIIAYINFLQVIYGPNIPQDIEEEVNQFYTDFFEHHVGKVCTAAFMNKNDEFQLHVLGLLQPIMMQQFMAELIITQNLQIVSHIFFHIQNSSYALKKQALICLINMIKSTIYQNSSSEGQILQLLLANKVADVLAFNLWAFVDTELNLDLLQGIAILLTAQANQYESKLRFQQSFQEAGGVMRLEKLIEQSGNAQLKAKAIKLLDSTKNQQQM